MPVAHGGASVMSATTKPKTRPDPQAYEQLKQLVARAQQGDAADLRALRAALNEQHPEVWTRHGDLAQHAQESWLELLAPDDLLLRESVRLKLEALRAELSPTEVSPLERHLLERVVACWLHVHYADALYAQLTGDEAPPAQRGEAERRQSSAQQRYLSAIKALATVRKLLRPAPSVFDLARRPVAETSTAPVQRGNLAADPRGGVPVTN